MIMRIKMSEYPPSWYFELPDEESEEYWENAKLLRKQQEVIAELLFDDMDK